MTDPVSHASSSRTTRVAGALFFIATVCFLISGIGLDQPLMLIAAGCNLVAWYVFVTRANQLEKQEQEISS